MRILVLDPEPAGRNHYIVLSIAAALNKDQRVEIAIASSSVEAFEVYWRERCDTVLVVGTAGTNSAVTERLCSVASKSGLWTTEDPYELHSNKINGVNYDCVFTNDKMSSSMYGYNVVHLPLAGSTLFNYQAIPDSDADYKFDVLFVGTAWPNRVEELNALISLLPPTTKFKIGLAVNPYVPKPFLVDPSIHTSWRCSNENFAKLANRSRVCLTLDRTFTSSVGRPAGSTPPPRIFEAAVAGAYQVYYSDKTETALYFQNLAHIAQVNSMPEAVEEIRWALENPRERIERAKAAQAHALELHTYESRCQRILDQLQCVVLRKPHKLDRKPRILLLSHNVIASKPWGGIEVYQQHYQRMSDKFDILIVSPVQIDGCTILRVANDGRHTIEYRLSHIVDQYALHDPELEDAIIKIIDDFDINMVHIQHLIGYSLSVPPMIKALGIPVIWTLHDYYIICKRFNLLDFSGKFCDIASRHRVQCDVCLHAAESLPSGAQSRRLDFIRSFASKIDRFIVNTPFTKNYVQAIYKELGDDLFRVVEMGLPSSVESRPIIEKKRRDGAVLQVVVPGNFTDVKGGNDIVRLIDLLRHDNIHFTIMGELAADFKAIFDLLSFANVDVHGGYDYKTAVRILSDFDVSHHLSIWPETYLISLSEAWSAGLVPVVYDLGAPGERVTDGVDGFTLGVGDIGGVAEVLRTLANSNQRLDQLRGKIAAKDIFTMAHHLDEISQVYLEILRRAPQRLRRVNEKVGKRFYSVSDWYRTSSASWASAATEWDNALDEPWIDVASQWSNSLPLGFPERDPGDVKAINVAWFLDALSLDAAPLSSVRKLSVRERIELRGWIHVFEEDTADPIFICLSDGLSSWYAALSRSKRPDVANYFGEDAALYSGIKGSFSVTALPQGRYALYVVHVVNGMTVRTCILDCLYLGDGFDNDGQGDQFIQAALEGRPLRPVLDASGD